MDKNQTRFGSFSPLDLMKEDKKNEEDGCNHQEKKDKQQSDKNTISQNFSSLDIEKTKNFNINQTEDNRNKNTDSYKSGPYSHYRNHRFSETKTLESFPFKKTSELEGLSSTQVDDEKTSDYEHDVNNQKTLHQNPSSNDFHELDNQSINSHNSFVEKTNPQDKNSLKDDTHDYVKNDDDDFDDDMHNLAMYRQFRFRKPSERGYDESVENEIEDNYVSDKKTFSRTFMILVSIFSVFLSVGIFLTFFDNSATQLTKIMVQDKTYTTEVPTKEYYIDKDNNLLVDTIIAQKGNDFTSQNVTTDKLSTKDNVAGSDDNIHLNDEDEDKTYVFVVKKPNPFDIQSKNKVFADALLTKDLQNGSIISNNEDDILQNAQGINEEKTINLPSENNFVSTQSSKNLKLRPSTQNNSSKIDAQTFSSVLSGKGNQNIEDDNKIDNELDDSVIVQNIIKQIEKEQKLKTVEEQKHIKTVNRENSSTTKTILKKETQQKKAVIKTPSNQTSTASFSYAIQFAAFRLKSEAERKIKQLQSFKGVYKEYPYTIDKRTIANSGTYYRVHLRQFSDKKSANNVCNSFKKNKISDCFVTR